MTLLRTVLQAKTAAAITLAVFSLPVVVTALISVDPFTSTSELMIQPERPLVVMSLPVLDDQERLLMPKAQPATPEPEVEPEPTEPTDQDAATDTAPQQSDQVADAGGNSEATTQPLPVVGTSTRLTRPDGLGQALADAAPTVAPKQRKRRKRDCSPDNPAIDKDTAGTIVIERQLVKYYVGHLGKLLSLGFASQHDGADGKPDGMRIIGVKCDNDLYEAGIRSGDVVHSVNGKAIKNIPQALFVYHAVKRKPVLEVEITRKGQRKTLRYKLT
jgi:hypothetical protein